MTLSEVHLLLTNTHNFFIMSKRKKETFYIDLTNLSETESEAEDAKPKSLSKNDLASVVDWMDVSDSEDD